MMAFNEVEVAPALGVDDFLAEASSWNQDVAEKLARLNEIWPLTEDHWRVIHFLRNYYLRYGRGPVVLKICRATGLSLNRICELFPCGMVRGAYRIAGLPRPPGCA